MKKKKKRLSKSEKAEVKKERKRVYQEEMLQAGFHIYGERVGRQLP